MHLMQLYRLVHHVVAMATLRTVAFATCVTVDIHNLISVLSSIVYSGALAGVIVLSQQHSMMAASPSCM